MKWSYENICSLWDFRREDNKERKKKGRILKLLAFATGGITALIWANNQKSSFSQYIIMCITIITFVFIHVIIHETGHLIGGLISGYRLISFRIFLLTFIKTSDHNKIKLQKLKGTGGQCLMLPPKGIELTKCPYYLYTMGGILFDMFVTILVFFSAIWLCDTPAMRNILLIYVVFGIYLAIENYFTFPKYILTNDGTNMRSIRQNELLRWSFMQQLIIYQSLCAGKDFQEFTEEEIELPKGSDITEPINSLFLNIQYMKYLKIRDFNNAEKILFNLESEYESMSRRMQLMIDVERLFLLLIQDADIRVIKTHYKNIKKDMKKNKSLASVLRTLYAYERIIHKENNKVIPIINRIKVMLHITPIKQEVQLNIELMEWLEEHIISME